MIYNECPACGCEEDYRVIFKCKKCNHIYCYKCGDNATLTTVDCPHCGARGGPYSSECTILGKEYDKKQKAEETRQQQKYQEREEELRQEELQRQKEEEEQEYERTHCFSCGEKGFLIEFHGKYFHEKCLQEFKQTEKGKEWIAQQERIEAAIIEAKRKREEKIRLEKERADWLKTEEGVKWTAEQERIKKEAEEKECLEREEQERIARAEELEKQKPHNRKRRWTAFVLCLLLGWLGIHRFYLGKIGTGILMFLTFGLVYVGWIVDLILLLTGNFKDSDGVKFKDKI